MEWCNEAGSRGGGRGCVSRREYREVSGERGREREKENDREGTRRRERGREGERIGREQVIFLFVIGDVEIGAGL